MNLNPIAVLDAARSAIPAVNYALGLAGMAAAAAIVMFFLGKDSASVIILGLTFIGMVLLFLLSTLVANKSPSVVPAVSILVYAVVIFFVFFMFITMTAFAGDWPCTWVRTMGVVSPKCDQGTLGQSDEPERQLACNSSVFSIGGSTGYDINELGLIDSFTPVAVRGSQFVFGLALRDDADIRKLSCLSIVVCVVETPNLCRTYIEDYRNLSGKINSFTYPIRYEAKTGSYRLHLKTWQVKDPADLLSNATGGFSLSDARLFSEVRTFEVR